MLSDKSDFLDVFNPRALAGQLAMKVRQRRLTLNLSQQVLADKSGVSLGTLKRFETKHEISLKYLLMLAIALQSSEEFTGLFPDSAIHRLDELFTKQHIKERKRGRRKV
ncbi:MAG: helix-turn-helix transcriptional regulator [Bacteroidota bacterium]